MLFWIGIGVVMYTVISIVTCVLHDYIEGYCDFEEAVLSFTPIVGQCIFLKLSWEFLTDIYDDKTAIVREYNRIYECKGCGIFSRLGYIKMVSTVKNVCPHCNSEHLSSKHMDDDIDLPLSPKLNLIQCNNVKKARKENERLKIVDSQLEKYQALQQKKMNERLDKSEQYKYFTNRMLK